MSFFAGDTPRPFQPPVAQRDIKAEVIHCVGGVIDEPCGLPSSVGANPLPGSNTPAVSQARISSRPGNDPIADIRWEWSSLSKDSPPYYVLR